jgi:hypothetical protein
VWATGGRLRSCGATLDRGDHIVEEMRCRHGFGDAYGLLHRVLGTVQRRIDGQDGEPIRKTLTLGRSRRKILR